MGLWLREISGRRKISSEPEEKMILVLVRRGGHLGRRKSYGKKGRHREKERRACEMSQEKERTKSTKEYESFLIK